MLQGELAALSFRWVVWLAPLAFVLHISEEWPQFVPWVNRFVSAEFTRRDYLLTHGMGLVSFVLVAGVLSRWSFPPLVFLFFTLLLLPAMLWNIGFHVSVTAFYRTYCPGVITAVVVYAPVVYLLTQSAWREGLISTATWIAAVLIAGVFHTWEVGHSVFKAW